MMPGSQSLSPTYEQAHVGLDLLTLASLYISALFYFRLLYSANLVHCYVQCIVDRLHYLLI